MSADTKTSKLYDAAIDEVTASGQAWKSICRLTGQLYRYEFDNILMVYCRATFYGSQKNTIATNYFL